jgi:hypothetical protein
MSWRSWLFPNSPAARAEKLFRDVQHQTDAVMQPLTALTIGIVSTSWQCTQAVKPYLLPNHTMGKHPELQEGYIYCEFIRFSVFLMSMSAFNCGLSTAKFAKLKEAITLLITHPTIDTFFAHVRDSVLENLIYDTLSTGDAFYGSSPDRFPRLAKNVLALAGYEVDGEQIDTETTKLVSLVESQTTQIFCFGSLGLENLREMVERASAAIEVCESDGSSLAQMFRDERREKTREREMQRV